MTDRDIFDRLDKKLIVCTSRQIWGIFTAQVQKVDPALEPNSVIRLIVRRTLLEVDHVTFRTNPICLKHQQPMDVWECDVGPKNDRVEFQVVPYHDRLIFSIRDNFEVEDDLIKNAIQVDYPECMTKVFDWIPFVTATAGDRQHGVYITGAFGTAGKRRNKGLATGILPGVN